MRDDGADGQGGTGENIQRAPEGLGIRPFALYALLSLLTIPTWLVLSYVWPTLRALYPLIALQIGILVVGFLALRALSRISRRENPAADSEQTESETTKNR